MVRIGAEFKVHAINIFQELASFRSLSSSSRFFVYSLSISSSFLLNIMKQKLFFSKQDGKIKSGELTSQ